MISKNTYRLWQTAVLALMSFFTFIWAAIDIFDVKAAEIMNYLMMAIILVMCTMAIAVVLVLTFKQCKAMLLNKDKE